MHWLENDNKLPKVRIEYNLYYIHNKLELICFAIGKQQIEPIGDEYIDDIVTEISEELLPFLPTVWSTEQDDYS